ncbi:hypothetical protein PATSB16_04420 [Pandoraea thiooxydans]|uniref:Pirin n=1 Tax=Pandoraea thiooxydans TaxID=445709 RepID=A0A0G3EQG7_9BURK|nr:pirin family protein [Pandoraea thiooxydans]AKJ66901.1 hypothetical protein ABW99_00290 [Pandoraea thiooxydans]APR93786.1 hypothetical protein PATSB16_04420 [Pandoraea thiooxydans]
MEKMIHIVHRASRGGATDQVEQNRMVVAPRDFPGQSPFLLLMEDWFRAPGGFATHPHRGFETVTLVLEGAIEHRDHTGSHGVLHAGDVQWMTAGGGVLHSELPHGEALAHTLQLWLNLPAVRKMTPARYRDQRLADTPVWRAPGVEVRVYAGQAGTGAQAVDQAHSSLWPLHLLDIRLAPGAAWQQTLPARFRGFAYVLEGSGVAGGEPTRVSATDAAWFEPGDVDVGADATDTLTLRAGDESMRVIVYAGVPIDEPVAAYGPFVMNTMSEVQRAYADFHAGRLTDPASGQS